MKRKVKTLMFGNDQECRAVAGMLQKVASNHIHEYSCVDNLEEFDRTLMDWAPSLLIVLANGAEGMECVHRARERQPNLPVFWFSDDRAFSMQSYRLNCAYFSTKPVTAEKIDHGIRRCNHVGHSFDSV